MTAPELSSRDRDVLRALADDLAAIAILPVHKQKARLWSRLNDLGSVRPMVWINEIPWNEMDASGELVLQCSDPWARNLELGFRRTLYQWRHLPADMILSDYLESPLAVTNTGFGLSEDVDIVRTDATSDIVSRHFHPQIVEPKDVEKIKMPVVTHDVAASEANCQRMREVFDGILPVRKVGVKNIWYTPWDNLIRWWGVQQAMIDLIERPEMVNEAVARCAASMNSGLDQMVKLNLLSSDANNTRIGSGGYGYTSALPGGDFNPDRVLPINNWGCSNAQIFSEVSPAMHWKFALRHDIPWLERWGLNYYGCCEPLDFKLEILRRIPRLRKISMNYRIKLDRAVAAVGGDYVFSYKPNPAVLAEDRWRPEVARQELREVLDKTRGMHVEIIMKDISTVGYQPQRLWEWQRMAMEMVETVGG